MIRWGFILFLFITTCGQTPSVKTPDKNTHKKTEWIYKNFVQLGSASLSLSISDEPNFDGVYIFDAPINSEFVREETTWYVFAPDFGIAISVPEHISKDTQMWTYRDCTFTPDANAAKRDSAHPKYYSFHSSCKNLDFQNDYLLTTSGELVAFNIYKKNKTGEKIQTATFVLANR